MPRGVSSASLGGVFTLGRDSPQISQKSLRECHMTLGAGPACRVYKGNFKLPVPRQIHHLTRVDVFPCAVCVCLQVNMCLCNRVCLCLQELFRVSVQACACMCMQVSVCLQVHLCVNVHVSMCVEVCVCIRACVLCKCVCSNVCI